MCTHRCAALRLPRFVLVVDQVVRRKAFFLLLFCVFADLHPKGKDVQILNIKIILFESPALKSCRKSALIGKSPLDTLKRYRANSHSQVVELRPWFPAHDFPPFGVGVCTVHLYMFSFRVATPPLF